MDSLTLKAAIEAQFLMGHWVAHPQVDADGVTITDFGWNEDAVRQALHVPLNDLWGQRVLELELQGLASFSMAAAPLSWDADGTEHEMPGWQDEPREQWGSVSIHARGILKLADLYGRPYVRYGESPALLLHWTLVQTAAEARLHAPHDEEQWEREYPERARARDEEQWQRYKKMYGKDGLDDGLEGEDVDV